MAHNMIVINDVIDLQWLVDDIHMPELIEWLNKNGEYFPAECSCEDTDYDDGACPCPGCTFVDDEPDITAVYTTKDPNEKTKPNL